MAKKAGYNNVFVLSAGVFNWKAAGHETITSLSAVESRLREGKVILVDLREADIVSRDGYIPGAVNIPFSEFDDRDDEYPADRNVPIVFYADEYKEMLFASSLLTEYLYSEVSIFPNWKEIWTSRNQLNHDKNIAKEVKWQGNFGDDGVKFFSFIKQRKDADIIVDIRQPFEYLEEHIPGAINIPIAKLQQKISPVLAQVPEGASLYLYCLSGDRASRAYEVLKTASPSLVNIDKLKFISSRLVFN